MLPAEMAGEIVSVDVPDEVIAPPRDAPHDNR
jgi:hypothetical protein